MIYLFPKAVVEIPISDCYDQDILAQIILNKDLERNYALSNISVNKEQYDFVGAYNCDSFSIEELVRFSPATPINRLVFKPLFLKGKIDSSGSKWEIIFQYSVNNYIGGLLLILIAGGLFYSIRSFFSLLGADSFSLKWFNLMWIIYIIYYVLLLLIFNIKVRRYQVYFENLI